MADIRLPFILEVKGDQAVLTMATNIESAGKRIQNTQQNLTDRFARSTAASASFASGLSTVSTTLARSASAFGLPIGPLKMLDDVADVAALGLSNLSKAAAGFNMASLGVIGAGLAIGSAIGTVVVKAFDDAVASAAPLPLEIQKVNAAFKTGLEGLKEWQAGIAKVHTGVQNTAAIAGVASQRRSVENLMGLGLSIPDVRARFAELGKVMDPAIDSWLTAMEKVGAQEKENAEEAKRAISARLDLQEKVTRAVEATVKAMNDEAAAAFMASAATADGLVDPRLVVPMPRGRDMSGTYGQFTRGEIATGSDQSGIRAAKDATIDWSHALSEVRAGMELLGISADSVFGRIIGSLSVIGKSMDAFGKGGFMNMFSGALGIVGAGFAIGQAIGRWIGGPARATPEEQQARREEIERDEARARQERQRIDEAARASRQRGVEGIIQHGPAFFAGLGPITTSEQAKNQGALFVAAWGAVVKERGVIAAADMFRETFERMKADILAAGFKNILGGGPAGVPEWMEDIQLLMDLSLDESFRGLAQAAKEATDFLRALGEAGLLGPDQIAAMEARFLELFNASRGRAIDLGKSEEEATTAGFAATAGFLQELVDQAVLQNTQLSPEVQALVDQAGIVPGLQQQQLEELRAIRAATQAIAGIQTAPPPGGPGPGGPNPHPNPNQPRPDRENRPDRHAAGGLGPMILPDMGGGLGPLIQTHAGELALIVPRHMVPHGNFRTARTPSFFHAAGGFGLRDDERGPGGGGQRGTGGGVIVSSDGSSAGGSVSGGTSSTLGQLAAVVEQLAASQARTEAAIVQLAEKPAATLTFAPTLNNTESPFATEQGKAEAKAHTLAAFKQLLRDLEPDVQHLLKRAVGSK